MCVNARNAETKGDAKRFESPPPPTPAAPPPGGGAADTAITCVQDECAMPRMRGENVPPRLPGLPGHSEAAAAKTQKMARWTSQGIPLWLHSLHGVPGKEKFVGDPGRASSRCRARREVPADSYALPETTPPVGGVDGVPRGARRRALICYMPLAFELFGSSLFATWGMPTTSEPTRTTRCVRLGRRFWTER